MSLDESLEKKLNEGLKEYLATPEFKQRVEDEYKKQLSEVISRAEKTGRWVAAIVGLLILAVFGALLTLQYADIRSKQADLYQKYADARDLSNNLHEIVVKLESNVKQKTTESEKRLSDYELRVAKVRSDVETLERHIAATRP